MKWWEVLGLRMRYGGLDTTGYENLLEETLRSVGKKPINSLHHLILEVGIDQRPTVDSREFDEEHEQWRYWLATALRYFPPLGQEHGAKVAPHKGAAVRNWIKYNPRLSQGLLFGDRALVYAILQHDFDSDDVVALLENLPQPSRKQAAILERAHSRLREKAIVPRQILNWARSMETTWAEGLQARLEVRVLVGISYIVTAVAKRFAGARGSLDLASLDELAEEFQKAHLDWAYGQTLLARHELTRRFRQLSYSAAWILPSAYVFAACLAASLISYSLGWLVGVYLRLVALVTLGLAVSQFVRLILIAISAIGELEVQLEALNDIRDRFVKSGTGANEISDMGMED